MKAILKTAAVLLPLLFCSEYYTQKKNNAPTLFLEKSPNASSDEIVFIFNKHKTKVRKTALKFREAKFIIPNILISKSLN